MARRNAGDLFSYSEFAIAGDMTKRAFQHLLETNEASLRSGLLPVGGGTRTVKRVAMIGGFVAAGVPLVSAARLASAVVTSEFNTYDGEAPSHLGNLARSLPRGSWRNIPDDEVDNDYWYHRALLEHPDIYQAGAALDNDVLVEIVDRTHVYVTASGGLRMANPWDNHLDQAGYVGRIEGWGRDSDAVLVLASEMAPLDREDPDFATKGAAVNKMSRDAYRNAVGRVTVNVSLAIRNGFDRIARHRGVFPGGDE